MRQLPFDPTFILRCLTSLENADALVGDWQEIYTRRHARRGGVIACVWFFLDFVLSLRLYFWIAVKDWTRRLLAFRPARPKLNLPLPAFRMRAIVSVFGLVMVVQFLAPYVLGPAKSAQGAPNSPCFLVDERMTATEQETIRRGIHHIEHDFLGGKTARVYVGLEGSAGIDRSACALIIIGMHNNVAPSRVFVSREGAPTISFNRDSIDVSTLVHDYAHIAWRHLELPRGAAAIGYYLLDVTGAHDLRLFVIRTLGPEWDLLTMVFGVFAVWFGYSPKRPIGNSGLEI